MKQNNLFAHDKLFSTMSFPILNIMSFPPLSGNQSPYNFVKKIFGLDFRSKIILTLGITLIFHSNLHASSPAGFNNSQQILLQALAAYNAQLSISAPNPSTFINTCTCPVPPQAMPTKLPNLYITMSNYLGTIVNSFTFTTNANFKSNIAILTVQLFPPSTTITSTEVNAPNSENSYAIVYTLQSPDGVYFQKEIQYPTTLSLGTFMPITNKVPIIPITLKTYQATTNTLLNTTQITASFAGLPYPTQEQLLNSISPITQKFFVSINSPTSSSLITATCTAATTANLSATYSNGSSGVGATLTATVNGAFSTDGVSPVINSRILVKNQATTFQNGIYTLTTVGTGSTPWILTRATDYNTASKIQYGSYVPITSGTLYTNTAWQETATVTTMGTSPILFSQISSNSFVTPACLAATTANLSATYSNGSSGVGATLTSTVNGAFSTDGVSPTLNSRILVKNQTTTFQNGIYTLTTVGTNSTPWILTRATDYDSIYEIEYATYVPITSGTLFANTTWQETATVTTIGVSPILFSQISSSNPFATNTCTAATTANLSATYSNGTSGVGATLTSTVNGAFATDGVSPAINSRILVKNQITTFQNGIYTLTTVGTSSTPWVLTRATDYDTTCEIQYGTYVPITSGTLYAGTTWQEFAIVTTIGVSPIIFSQLTTPSLTCTSMSGSYDPNSNLTTPTLISSLIPTTITTVPPIDTTDDITIAPITVTLYSGTTLYPITFTMQDVKFNQTDLLNGLNLNLFIYPPLYQNGPSSNYFIFIATLQTLDGLKFKKIVNQSVPLTNYPITFSITTTSLEGEKTNLVSNIANPLLTPQIYNMISPIRLQFRLQQNDNNVVVISIT
jgi:hypothetical protein